MLRISLSFSKSALIGQVLEDFLLWFTVSPSHCISSMTLQRTHRAVTQIVCIFFHRELDFCLKHLRYSLEHGHSEGMRAGRTHRQIFLPTRFCASAALSQKTCLTGSLAHRAFAFFLKRPAEMLARAAVERSRATAGKLHF